MRLHIIRHGSTEAYEKQLYCGFTDLSLSESGRRALASLKSAVDYPVADICITSGLARATESLRIIYNREPDLVFNEFMEMNFGEFEMKSYEELKDVPAYKRWLDDLSDFLQGEITTSGSSGGGRRRSGQGEPISGDNAAPGCTSRERNGGYVCCPHGESRRMFDCRVKAGMHRLIDTGIRSAIVMCHGGVIVSIMNMYFPGQKNFYEWQPDNGRGYSLEITHEHAAIISRI